MLSVGLPLTKSLTILGRRAESEPLRKAILHMVDSVSSGKSFKEAVQQEKDFSNLYCAMVGIGESSGALPTVLTKLAVYLRAQEKIKRKVVTALTYPAVIMVISMGLILVMMTLVIPAFSDLFSDFGSELPQATRTVLLVSQWLSQNKLMLFSGIVLSGVMAFQLWNHSKFKSRLDRLLLQIPGVNTFVKKSSAARYTYAFAVMLEAGVPLTDALRITSTVADNAVIERALLDTLNHIHSGNDLAAPLSKTGVVPPLLVEMVAIGQETGRLSELLMSLSHYFNEEIEGVVERFLSLVEPIMIVVLGLGIAGILMALYLPMFEMMGAIQ